MDPIALLKRLRRIAASIVAASEREAPIDRETASELAEGFQALDEWLRKGGFSPWSAK